MTAINPLFLDSLTLTHALKQFAAAADTDTSSQRHIRPMHRHLSVRLVLEGGFMPDHVTPRPPIAARQHRGGWVCEFDTAVEGRSEFTIIGGMKSKDVDVVVAPPNLGPSLGISVKGTLKAFRNLTNRMEEAIGDCTNVHVMYPGFVYGFLHLMRANRQGEPNDLAIDDRGEVVDAIKRYAFVLQGITGRKLVRNDVSRYERVALALVERDGESQGQVLPSYPVAESPLLLSQFLRPLYDLYDLRYPYMLPHPASARRTEWRADSNAITTLLDHFGDDLEQSLGYSPRIA